MVDNRRIEETRDGCVPEETKDEIIERLEREKEELEVKCEALLAHAMEEMKAKYHRGELSPETIAHLEAKEGWDWNLTNEEMNAKLAAKRAAGSGEMPGTVC